MKRSAFAVLSLWMLTGCYSFQTVGVEDLTPGQTVRLRVTGAYSDTLSAQLSTDDARVVEGEVVEDAASEFMLEVPVSTALEGMRFETLNQRVSIPDDEVVEVELKQLSQGRTFAAAGTVGLIVGALVVQQLRQRAGGGNRPGTGGPQDSLIPAPVVSVPIGVIGRIFGR